MDPAFVAQAAARALELAEGFDHRPRYRGRVSVPAGWAADAARLLTFLAGVAVGGREAARVGAEPLVRIQHVREG